jgi:hypothetical protein
MTEKPKVTVKVPVQRQAPQKHRLNSPQAVSTEVPRVEKKPSLFSKCLTIISQDIRDAMNGGRESRQKSKELYRQFCELAKGREKV